MIPGQKEVHPLGAADLHQLAEAVPGAAGKRKAPVAHIQKAVMLKDRHVVHTAVEEKVKGLLVAPSIKAVMGKDLLAVLTAVEETVKDLLVAHSTKAVMVKDQHVVHSIKAMKETGLPVVHTTKAVTATDLVALTIKVVITNAATANLPRRIIPAANPALQVRTEACA